MTGTGIYTGLRRILIVDDTTGTASGQGLRYDPTVTFTPTSNHTDTERLLEDEADRLVEIDRLDDMMCQKGVHETIKYALQRREVKHARLAPVKHKKPHMNRKVI